MMSQRDYPRSHGEQDMRAKLKQKVIFHSSLLSKFTLTVVSPTFQRVNTSKPLPSGRYSGEVGASLHMRYHCDKSIKNGRLTKCSSKGGPSNGPLLPSRLWK